MDWIFKLCKSCSHDKEFLSIGRINESKLFYDKWKVVNLSEGNELLKKFSKVTYADSGGGGVKKWRLQTAQSVAISHVSGKKLLYKICNTKFNKNYVSKPVWAKHVHSRHQLCIVDMHKCELEGKGKTYHYILLLMDVFSRYCWLVPLETKSSRQVSRALEHIYNVHRSQERL